MKKILFSFVITLFLQTFTYSQKDFRIGLFGGANYSTHKGSILENTDGSFVHFTGGFSVEYIINKSFSLKTALGFEKKRIDYFTQASVQYFDMSGNYVVETTEVTTENRYNYLTIPLLLKYSFGPKKSFFANFGPYMSTQTEHDRKTTYSNPSNWGDYPNSEYNFPLSSSFSGLEFGISAGFGKSFSVTNKSKITLELRNNFGLTNRVGGISRNGVTSDLKTNTFNFITEFSFGL